MRVYNKYLLTLAIAFAVVNVSLAALGQDSLFVYLALNTIVYLTVSLLYVYVNPRARMLLTTVGTVLFAGFLVFVALRVIEVVGR